MSLLYKSFVKCKVQTDQNIGRIGLIKVGNHGILFNKGIADSCFLGGLFTSLNLYPFMPQRKLTTDEEVNSATASGMYHVTGDNGISVVLNYSIMIVFNDGQGYVIQMAFRLGVDVAGFRRCLNGEWGDFRTFVLAS